MEKSIRYNSIPPKDEHEFQSLCHAWLERWSLQTNTLLIHYAIPNGAKLPARKVHAKYKGKALFDENGNPKMVRVSREANKLLREGLLPGVADYFISKPVKTNQTKSGWYHGLYIELKYGDNKQSESQIAFMKSVISEDYLYLVIYDNRSILDANGGLDPLLNFKIAVLKYLNEI